METFWYRLTQVHLENGRFFFVFIVSCKSLKGYVLLLELLGPLPVSAINFIAVFELRGNILQSFLTERSNISYNLRDRSHNRNLLAKSATLNGMVWYSRPRV